MNRAQQTSRINFPAFVLRTGTPMAVMLRCSCLLSRPHLRQPPLRGQFSGNMDLVPGRFAPLCLKVEKFVPFLKVTFAKSSETQPMLSCSNCQEDKNLAFLAMLFLANNILMLSTPCKALAETCDANNSSFNMPLLLSVALIGATVGGLLARQRRGELKRLNDQLRQINAALRRQAKIESYAPTLSYAPVGGRILENEVIVDPRKEELISKLKTGKNFLRNQEPEKAFLEFKMALEMSQNLKDPVEEKKAARGLGASLQRQGKYREAIKYHSMVLAVSEREGEDSGNTEAYGAIADCYTELGDLERAGQFYDKYISRLEKD
ncbi:protein FLUORESCENT IN BLUE LIGHT, chloroplastic [Prosopis cineraria]|uniref:protein FLUORESCENT IN BLUE LIGHT, chloroplastic n=1 Tax=Prosopis cineraria TaxID=364024 RepID=UPI00240F4860|nr:protein FLUORESCENT IN BLUE LIGHT, chloroplastic [Prosopis cineraria]